MEEKVLKCFRARSYGYGDRPFTPQWGIIIPHTMKAQGAVTYDGIYTEYVYGTIMIPMIGVPFAKRDENGVYGAAKDLRSVKVNATIEPHFNAFNGRAAGAEILILREDGLSRHYAELFLDIFKETYPSRKIRGVKEVGPRDRGYSNLLNSKKVGMEVAILSELFFGDNPKDFLLPEDQATYWRDCLDSNINYKVYSGTNDRPTNKESIN